MIQVTPLTPLDQLRRASDGLDQASASPTLLSAADLAAIAAARAAIARALNEMGEQAR
jgi:hypothetical protein